MKGGHFRPRLVPDRFRINKQTIHVKYDCFCFHAGLYMCFLEIVKS